MSDSDSTSDSEKKFIEHGSHKEENSSDEENEEKGAVGGDKPKKILDQMKSVATKIGRKLGRNRSKSPNDPSSSTTAPKSGTSELCVPGSGTKRGRSPSKSPPGDPTSKTIPEEKPEQKSSSIKDILKKKVKKVVQPGSGEVKFVNEENDMIAEASGVGPPPKSPPPPPPTPAQLENLRLWKGFVSGAILGSITPTKEDKEDEEDDEEGGNTIETDIGPSSDSTTPMEFETRSVVGDTSGIPVPKDSSGDTATAETIQDTSGDAAQETIDETSGDAAQETIDDTSCESVPKNAGDI